MFASDFQNVINRIAATFAGAVLVARDSKWLAQFMLSRCRVGYGANEEDVTS
jgi:hypothetical protein